MTGPAGRVKDTQISRILLLALCPSLIRPTDHVFALLVECGLTVAHFVPDAAECVVSQDLDYVARREELITDCQFAAVPRRLTGVPHRPALILAIMRFSSGVKRITWSPAS